MAMLDREKLDDLLNAAIVSTAQFVAERPTNDGDGFFIGYLLSALRDRFNLTNADDCLTALGRMSTAAIRYKYETLPDPGLN